MLIFAPPELCRILHSEKLISFSVVCFVYALVRINENKHFTASSNQSFFVLRLILLNRIKVSFLIEMIGADKRFDVILFHIFPRRYCLLKFIRDIYKTNQFTFYYCVIPDAHAAARYMQSEASMFVQPSWFKVI